MKLFYFLLSMIGMLFCISEASAKHKIHHPSHHAAHHAPQHVSHHFLGHRTYAVPPAIYGSLQLSNELNQLIASEDRNADIAVYVKSMKYGDSVYARNVYKPLTPASTLKILTAEAALVYLGGDYRFSTHLLTDAKTIKNGVLQGNLYIVLSGDPSLSYNDLFELMFSLKNQQVQAIAGNVYIDNSAYDQSFYGPGWGWKDKKFCFAAPISASIIDHNCLSFKIPARNMSVRRTRTRTSARHFTSIVKNSVTTHTSHSASCSMRLSKNGGSNISIDGCIPEVHYASRDSYAVTDIPEYDRTLFKNLLRQLAIRVYGNITFAVAPDDLSQIDSHASQPLRVLINDMLKKSNNVIAGAIFKKLGQSYTNQPGSWENGSLAVSDILATRLGVKTAGLRILDGSGLSPYNLASPIQMMQVLDYAFHHTPNNIEFINSLPIAGIDGTLKHRMGNIARKVRAKTGTISGVVSLAGYVISADSEPYGFVIMINGMRGMGWRYKSLEDKIATALTRYKRT